MINDSYQERDFRAVTYLFSLLHDLELYLLESLPHNRKYMTNDFLVTLADLTVKLLTGNQFFIFRKLKLHFLSLQHVYMMLKHHTDFLEGFAKSRTEIWKESKVINLRIYFELVGVLNERFFRFRQDELGNII